MQIVPQINTELLCFCLKSLVDFRGWESRQPKLMLLAMIDLSFWNLISSVFWGAQTASQPGLRLKQRAQGNCSHYFSSILVTFSYCIPTECKQEVKEGMTIPRYSRGEGLKTTVQTSY